MRTPSCSRCKILPRSTLNALDLYREQLAINPSSGNFARSSPPFSSLTPAPHGPDFLPAEFRERSLSPSHSTHLGSLGRAMEKMLRREAGTREVARLLTSRELEIVRLAASGLRNKEIASKLAISEGTVKVHLHRSYEKLHVDSRMALLRYAQTKGLV
jgi:DNA-binding CsgD family transcriptional regulator